MGIDAHHGIYRFIILFLNCLLTFGSYFCFDMPSVLQATFQGNFSCDSNANKTNVTCCEDCLGMGPDQFNLLYAIYAWTNAVVVIGAGFLVDKLGNRLGIFLFSSLCVAGTSIFALGSYLRGTEAMLPLMLVGRLLFGAGNGSLTIVQNRITSFWFLGKELALAFGITLTFSRLASVLNFLLTDTIYSMIGLTWTLWAGTLICVIGLIAAIFLSIMDKVGMRQLGREFAITADSKRMHFLDIRYFSTSFWLLAVIVMFFYNGLFPFVADASKFIQDKYGHDKQHASYIAGSVYDVSILLSPFLGGLIDVIGKRGYLASSCAVLTIPVFAFLAFTEFHPLISTIWLGITYSVAAACLWPSIPLVVSQSTLGTALGVTTSIQMIGTGISNVVVGIILGNSEDLSHVDELRRWKFVMVYLLLNIIACFVCTVVLNIVDRQKGGILNISRQQMQALLRRSELDFPANASMEESYEQSDPASVPYQGDQDILVPSRRIRAIC